jgi:prolyl-tRNA synthetase
MIGDFCITWVQIHMNGRKKGVPVRLEVGPRDVESQSVVLVRRDTGEKEMFWSIT